jgi:hypothetical protein
MTRRTIFPLALMLLFGTCLLAQDQPQATLVDVRKIWDYAPHNAFTDLVRFRGRWFCVFREGQAHVSPDGALRVISSPDGQQWESAARIASPTGDLRDAKICVTPDGQLMLSGAEAFHDRSRHSHQSLVWFSRDGRSWTERHEIGEPDYWLWRTTWHRGRAYAIGYGCRDDNQQIRLYHSDDGRRFSILLADMNSDRYPNETSMVFTKDDTCYCLVRRDGAGANGLLATSVPPYTAWTWSDLGHRIGGPHMIQLSDGRLVAVVRLYEPVVRTSVCRVEPAAGTLTEILQLPSAGDTSYAGLVWHDDRLWISYYSSHEAKTSIYLARVRFRGGKSSLDRPGRGREAG